MHVIDPNASQSISPGAESPELIAHKDGQRSFRLTTQSLLLWRKAVYSRYVDASCTGATSIYREDRDFQGKLISSSDDILALELQEDAYRTIFDIYYNGIKALKINFYFKLICSPYFLYCY